MIGTTGTRFFRYEVVGIRQSDETDNMNHAIRSSSSTFIRVPYNRMNQEMQRITRMGGTIVNIEAVNVEAVNVESEN
jgi:sulfite reductase alpha subunit-like flavoprotein